MRALISIGLTIALTAGSANAGGQAPQQTPPPSAANPSIDMPRPIDAVDSVFIEELTWLEVRDAIRAGKKNVIVATGGIEQNGPYLTTGKHNNVLRAMGDPIARSLGNALIAPIVTLEPGNPERVRTPGTIFLSPETYRAVLTDMAVRADNIDEAAVEAARKRAEERLKEKVGTDEEAVLKAAMANSLAQLKVKRKQRH